MDNLYNGQRVLYVLTEADLEVVWDDMVAVGKSSRPLWEMLPEDEREAVCDVVQDALDASMDGWYDAMTAAIYWKASYE